MLLPIFVTFCALAARGCVAQDVNTTMNPCEALRNCTRPLESLDFTEGMPLADLEPSISNVDILCEEVQTMRTCVADVMDLCSSDGIRIAVTNVLDVGDHICDPMNRQAMEELFHSDCATNSSVKAQLESEFEDCIRNFGTEVRREAMEQHELNPDPSKHDYSVYCPHVYDFEECLVRVATYECGRVAGEFVATVWDIAIQNHVPDEISSCFADVVASRRALEHMVPAIAKRHFEKLDWLLK